MSTTSSDAVELAKDLGRLRQDADPRASVRSTLTGSGAGYGGLDKELLRKGTVYRCAGKTGLETEIFLDVYCLNAPFVHDLFSDPYTQELSKSISAETGV